MAKQDDAMAKLVEHYTRLGEQERHARAIESHRTQERWELYGENSAQWVKQRDYKGGSQGSY